MSPKDVTTIANLSLSWQFEYDDWLAAESGSPPVEEWRKKMYFATGANRKIRPETYRDEWDDDELILQAHEDFLRYLPTQGSPVIAPAL